MRWAAGQAVAIAGHRKGFCFTIGAKLRTFYQHAKTRKYDPDEFVRPRLVLQWTTPNYHTITVFIRSPFFSKRRPFPIVQSDHHRCWRSVFASFRWYRSTTDSRRCSTINRRWRRGTERFRSAAILTIPGRENGDNSLPEDLRPHRDNGSGSPRPMTWAEPSFQRHAREKLLMLSSATGKKPGGSSACSTIAPCWS